MGSKFTHDVSFQGTAVRTLLVLGLVLVGIPTLATPVGAATPGPMAQWRFEEGTGPTAHDSAGANDGTINGATWTKGFGGALDFDGIDDYVRAGPVRVTTAASVELWVRPDSVSGEQTLLLNGTGEAQTWNLHFHVSNGVPMFRVHTGSIQQAPGGTLQTGTWYHLAGTFNGATRTLRTYINGQLVGEKLNVGSSLVTPTNVLTIGSYLYNGAPAPVFTDGVIDEVSIYNVALSDTQVMERYLAGLLVGIDVKPGIYPNTLQIDGLGVIEVAVLGSARFDVTKVDASSLVFAGLDVARKKNGTPQCTPADVSGNFTLPHGAPDGYPDLVCRFVEDVQRWKPDDGTATVTGTLKPAFGSFPFAGTDTIALVVNPGPAQCTVKNLTSGKTAGGTPAYQLAVAVAAAKSGEIIEITGGCSKPFVPLQGTTQFTIDKDLTVRAPTGAILEGNGGRVLEVDADVTLIGLTIRGGQTTDWGGGIFNRGSLTLINCVVSGNTAMQSGGGIGNSEGSVTLTASTVSGNTAVRSGGGIANYSDIFSGTVTLDGSTVSGNHVTGEEAYGGGISNEGEDAIAKLTGSTVSGNAAYYGGGIHNWDGTLVVSGSTLSQNQATYGGGLNVWGGTVDLDSSKVNGNTAVNNGGGLDSWNGNLSLDNSQVNGNSADWAGGMDLADEDPVQSVVTLTDSTVSGNQDLDGPQGGGPGGIGNHVTLTLTGSTVSDNEGKGIVNFEEGTLTLNSSTVSGNTAEGDGAGIFTYYSTATLNDSTVSGNESTDDNGGGLTIYGGILTLDGSTVSGNTAACGGGIHVIDEGIVTLIDSQVVANAATRSGGGICSQPDETEGSRVVTLSGNTNVTGNSALGVDAEAVGGGIQNSWGGDLDPGNSIVQAANGTNAYADPVTGETLPAWTGAVNDNTPWDCAGPGTYINVCEGVPYLYDPYTSEMQFVDEGKDILIRPGWGFASDTSLTDPSDYLGAVLDSMHFQISLDDVELDPTGPPAIAEDLDFCGETASGGTLCTPLTVVRYEWLIAAEDLSPGEHAIVYRFTTTVDFPDDGFGYDFYAEDSPVCLDHADRCSPWEYPGSIFVGSPG